MIRYGTNPIAWANDDDQTIGADIPTEQILHEAGKVIGFDGMEGGHRWPDDPEELRALMAKHDLVFVSGWYSTDLLVHSVEDEIAKAQPFIARLKHNGCKVLIAAECSNTIHGDGAKPLSERPRLTAEELVDFGEKLEAFAQYLKGEGIKLVYHPHMGTIIETPEEVDALMAATGPATHLLFDSGHCFFGGGDPALVLAKHGPRVGHMHAKNVRREVMEKVRSEGLSFLNGVVEGVFTVPGDPEGAIDFGPLMETLAHYDYDGWLVIEAEQDPKVRNPLEYQTLGLKTLREAAAAAGLDKG